MSNFTLTSFITLFSCCLLSSVSAADALKTNSPAPAANALPQHSLIDSLDGPVTANELKVFGDLALSQPLPTHNNHNNLVYGRSHQAHDLLLAMYELTGDRIYLNRLIEFSDAILACRNDTNTGSLFWTGKREATWPSGTEISGGTNYLTTHVESGAILEMLAHCARVIIDHKELWNDTVPVEDKLHLGKTYIERARSYIRECNFTIDTFIVPWSVKTMTNGDLRLYFSESPELARLDGKAGRGGGKPIPWNQQFMLVRSLVRLADDLRALDEDKDRIALYDKIAQGTVDWFQSTLHQTNVNGEIAYEWSYTPNDATLHYIENSAHGSSDVEGMYVCYQSGHYGITPETMRRFANTPLLVMYQDGKFTSNVRGGGGFHGLSTAWMPLAEFRPELYKLIAEPGLKRPDLRQVRILKWKNGHSTSGEPQIVSMRPVNAVAVETPAATPNQPFAPATANPAPEPRVTEPLPVAKSNAPKKSTLVSLPTGFRH
ncbi:MAG TPA: hypothetical protein VN625_01005 [Desulfuromonadaceae bacterium]|nr:hypothetical protein [Desulfuromonadaceae bacterium]